MPRTIRTIAAALTALVIAAPPAFAMPIDSPGHPSETTSAPKQDLRSPDARDAAKRPQTPADVTAALAQERYYSSYGDPEPLDVTAAQYAASKQPEPAPASGDSEPLDVTAAQYAASKQPEPASAPASVRFADTGDGIDSLSFVLGLVGALIVGVAAGTGMHQLVVRRRHATGLPA
jgi:hypothetical protein